jgi:hypothetical protein
MKKNEIAVQATITLSLWEGKGEGHRGAKYTQG